MNLDEALRFLRDLLLIIGGGAGTYAAARVTAKVSKAAVDRTAEAEEKADALRDRASEIEGYDRLTQRLEARLDDVEKDASETRQEAAVARRENRQLAERVDELEDSLRETRSTLRDALHRFSVLVRYARSLMTILREHEVEVPEPPLVLLEHLDDDPLSPR